MFSLGSMPKKAHKVAARPIDVALELAAERGWNKSEFATRMDTLPQHVTNWIKRGMPPERHARAAEVLGVTVDRLLGRSELKDGKNGLPPGIEQRHIDLIRQYQRLPEEVRDSIRGLINVLSFYNHPSRDEYVKNVTSYLPKMIRDKERA